MKELRHEVIRELDEHIMPFWMNLRDDEHGGFFGKVDYHLTINKQSDKGGIAAARLLWSFSAAYRVTKKEKYLEYAHHTYDFLVSKVYDAVHEGLFWMLDYKGNPVDKRKHIYAQAFGIYGLSEYYRATGNEEALGFAMRLYDLIESKGYCAENNAYLEEFSCEWIKKDNEMLSENGILADITTNTHLHILEAYTNLYRARPNKELRNRLMNMIHIFYSKIYDHQTHALKVFFNNQWDELIPLKSFGHDIEASWLMDDAIKVLRLDNKRYDQMVIDIANNIAKNAMLEDGSILNEQEGVAIDCTRIWWGQAEAMVGFYNAYERTNDARFINLTYNLWKYTKENIIDNRENSEWFWSVEAEGKPTKRDIAEPWKTPYHNVRFCLEMIERMS